MLRGRKRRGVLLMIFVLVIAGMLAVGFFNGANDASKSIATLVGSGVTRYRTAIIWGSLWTFVGGAFAAFAAQGLVAAFSLIRGFKVTETLAQKVTPMTPLEGLSANLVTSVLVIIASRFALPVSTTHVSSAAIIGLGLKRNAREVRWKTVGEMLLAWIVTLPAAAILAATAYSLFRFIS